MYILFGGYWYYPQGGASDIKFVSDKKEELRKPYFELLKENKDTSYFVHCYDVAKQKIFYFTKEK